MKRKIYSASSKRYKATGHLPKSTHHDPNIENTGTSTNQQTQKLFFEMDYLFSEPVRAKKHAERRLISSQANRQTINTSSLSCNLPKTQLPHPDNKQPKPINHSFFTLSSIVTGQERRCKQLELVFDQNRHGQLIHHRRIASLGHPFPHKNHSKEYTRLADCEASTIEECLTTRSFVKEVEKDEIQKKINVHKSHKVKKNGGRINNLSGVGELLLSHKKNWFQSDYFREYYSKEVQFAKRAFIDKNKQTIKIYRPWTPTQFQLEESEQPHF